MSPLRINDLAADFLHPAEADTRESPSNLDHNLGQGILVRTTR